MKSERLKNHGTHIMYTLHLLSSVLYTLRSVLIALVFCANIHPASKLLVTMDSTSSVIIPSLTHLTINTSHPLCFSFTIKVCVLSVIFPTSPRSFIVGRSIAISYVVNLFSKDLCVSPIFSHGFNHVGYC
jgi:hypothetical protein